MTTKITADNIEQATLDTISGGPAIANIQIANSSYSALDDTAVDTAGGYILINGTKFANGCTVLIGNSVATSVTFVSATQIRAQVPAKNNASYVVYVTNPDGGTAIAVNALTYSNTPVWSTGSTLPTGATDSPISISLSAPSDSNVTYTVAAGSSLPSGITLASNGLLSGTISGLTSETTYNFTVVATDVQLQDASRAFSITITAGDVYYKNTTIHLNGETSSNTWISDASTNKLAVTVSGDTRPASFSPYETVWSNSFDGTGDYLSLASNTAFDPGAGDWSVECWVYPTYTSGVDKTIIGNLNIASYPSNCPGWDLIAPTPTTAAFRWGYPNYTDTGSFAISTYKWNHLCVSRSGGRLSFYINGTRVYTTTTNTSISASTASMYVGWSGNNSVYNGYISNVRIVKGSTPYDPTSTSLIVPTSPLTAITNTTLLTSQSNRLLDSSTNAFTITKNGDVSVRSFGPFDETDFTTGSGYFDGTGDYLTVPGSANSAFNFQTGVCIEGWSYITTASNYGFIMSSVQGQGNFVPWWYIGHDSSGNWRVSPGDATDNNLTGYPMRLNSWNHFALTNDGSRSRLFVNGVLIYTKLVTPQNVDQQFTFSQYGGSNSYLITGYVSDVRIIKGSSNIPAAYVTSSTTLGTTVFTPPTSRLTAITGTSLLTLQSRTGENNNRFVDSSGINNIITRNGNVTQGTFSPFSPSRWSNYFNGTDSILSFPNSSNFAFGTGAFTIEFWINAATASNSFILGGRNAIGGMHITLGGFGGTTSGSLRYVASSTITSGATLIADNNWHHCAIVRDGSNNITLYVDGVSRGTGTDTNNYSTTSGSFLIGRNDLGASEYLNGYLSNFRIIKGTALYTTTFTPPTSPLSIVSNTSILTCQSRNFQDTSLNNLAITVTGAPSVQPFSPFAPSIDTPASYSVYFDGTGDYLSVPYSSSTAIYYDQDFTMEMWVAPASLAVSGTNSAPLQITHGDATTSSLYWAFGYNSSGRVGLYYYNGASQNVTASSGTVLVNNWNHLALTYTNSSSTIKLYLNGTLVGSGTISSPQSSASFPINIGVAQNTFYTGYISNVRIVKGTVVYTDNFTPPTSQLSAISNTKLLTCQSSTIKDNSTSNFTITRNGDARPNQSNPFGYSTNLVNIPWTPDYIGGSLYLDGTGDYLNWTNSLFTFGTSDFTVEAWIYMTGSTDFGVFGVGGASAGSYGLYYSHSTSKFQVIRYGDTAGSGTTTNTYAKNQWLHVAAVRTSGTARFYVNGVLDSGSTYSMGSITNSGAYTGAVWAGATGTGYLSGLKVYNSAIYSGNFTPPTAPSIPGGAIVTLNNSEGGIVDYTTRNTFETVGDVKVTNNTVKYGSGSMYFDGNGDFLLNRNINNVLTFNGSSTFTVEGWFYQTAYDSTSGFMNNVIGDLTPNSTFGDALYWSIGMNSANKPGIRWYGGPTVCDATNALTLNTWNHVAWVVTNGAVKIFINGVQETLVGTTTITAAASSMGYHVIGADRGKYYTGYIDDLRITRGVARYTTNFTPPTSAFMTK